MKKKSPLNNVEAGHAILAPHGVEKAPEHRHTHARPAGACGGHVAAPLVRLGVIPAEDGKSKAVKSGYVYIFSDIYTYSPLNMINN